MLSQAVIQANAENRRCQRPKISINHITGYLNLEDYENIVQWIFETSDELKLMDTTKCLARTYFDLTFFFDWQLQKEDYLKLVIACICLAIKFNEIRDVSDQLTPQFFISRLNMTLTSDQYFSIEAKIISILNFKFKYTTPYDFVDIFMTKFPFYPKMLGIFPIMIKLALTQPLACQFSAEEIFFGSVLAIIERSKTYLDVFKQNIFLRLTDCWPRAKIMGVLLLQSIKNPNPNGNVMNPI